MSGTKIKPFTDGADAEVCLAQKSSLSLMEQKQKYVWHKNQAFTDGAEAEVCLAQKSSLSRMEQMQKYVWHKSYTVQCTVYTIAFAPSTTGSVFVQGFQLSLIQCI